MFRAKPMYYDFRLITARYADDCKSCGAPIKPGDRIGHERRYGALCGECFRRWSAEVAAEEFDLAINRSL